jgi:hypothetical protein
MVGLFIPLLFVLVLKLATEKINHKHMYWQPLLRICVSWVSPAANTTLIQPAPIAAVCWFGLPSLLARCLAGIPAFNFQAEPLVMVVRGSVVNRFLQQWHLR